MSDGAEIADDGCQACGGEGGIAVPAMEASALFGVIAIQLCPGCRVEAFRRWCETQVNALAQGDRP
jgi:hypothetical protein